MKRLMLLMVAMFGAHAVAEEQSWPQQDGDVTVIWQQPDEYSDVEAASGIQSRYQNHVFATLGKHLQKKITPNLGEGNKMVIVVTNLDLAGDVRPTFGAGTSDIRVVKSVYPPRISFNYQVTDGTGATVEQNQIELKDLGFDTHHSRRYNSESLHYEMVMLDKWVNKTLKQQLAQL